MCRRVSCSRCGKYTYAGCGNHVDQVLSGVPAAQRCSCAPLVRERRSWWPFGRG
ncbi:hypothetical protein [Streptacidiphilus rugosus]|uniref:hypothetical protein n=1 Tax=Streptacidiphilus rugosus TaxID=405783 RepID=UPI000A5660AC|nr:hypothetical protein [Streptacidiphilus rugosus]